MLNNFVDEEEL